MDAMTSVLNTVNLKAVVGDGTVRLGFFRIDNLAFRVWAHGAPPLHLTEELRRVDTLTQTIMLSIGKGGQADG